jgi:hypothetical protein
LVGLGIEPFYDAVCRPFDGHYTMGLCLVVDRSSVAGVVLNRNRKRPFTDHDRDFGARLMPHLQTWFRLRQRIGSLRLGHDEGLQAIEALDHGAMIVDAEGLVVAANPIARRLVHASGGTLRLGPRLGSRQAGVESRLLRAVRSVATDAGPGVAFPIETAQGRMQIAVLPLQARPEHETRAVVFIQDRSLSELRALKSLDTRFDLTQAEQRVALQILTGHSATARALGISPETVKSHLRSIFRKTSTAAARPSSSPPSPVSSCPEERRPGSSSGQSLAPSAFVPNGNSSPNTPASISDCRRQPFFAIALFSCERAVS